MSSGFSRRMKCSFYFCALSVFFFSFSGNAQPPPIYVTLWFDTEDYILPESDDAAKRLAEMLTRLGIKATFKVVGEKARVLEQRGRKDVIAALKKHEIGYHSNLHSQHPTPAEYLQNTDWDEGVAEFYRRESQGVKDIQRIFGQAPSCYGQPGSSWGAQAYPALKQMGINVYLDEANHVGIDDQPFYYGGMLNIFKLRPNVCRMELFGENNLANGKAKFLAAYEKLKAKGGGTISIYYHPCEFIHQEFWDAVNFSRGANPERKDWKLPRTRTKEETEKAFRDFEEYVKFIRVQSGVRYVTVADLGKIYEDGALKIIYEQPEMIRIARNFQREITFHQLFDFILSPADAFHLLTEVGLAHYDRKYDPIKLKPIQGPTRSFVAPGGVIRAKWVNKDDFFKAVRVVSDYCKTYNRVPNSIWIGSWNISPADYLATIAYEVEHSYLSGRDFEHPNQVPLQVGNFTADKYVAEDDPKIFNWVIHPEGFHAPKIMELAKLQAWTLKPAVMNKSLSSKIQAK